MTTFRRGDGPPIEPSRIESSRRFGSITETVVLDGTKFTVSYSDPELLLTPEIEAKLAAFWKRYLDRCMAQVLGAYPTPPNFPE